MNGWQQLLRRRRCTAAGRQRDARHFSEMTGPSTSTARFVLLYCARLWHLTH